ncbi:MAG TPA: serine/threonine-protein kinase, partial [Nannocystis sp.]
DPILVRRFAQEGQLAAQIRHPNLVPAYDLGWVGGRRYIVLELVDGTSLNARLKDGPLPWARSVPIVLDVLAGLAALHARGVTHRDISPNNCMIEVRDGTERAYLLDLGYARVIEDRGLVLTPPDASVSKIIYGSEGFIAPERLHGRPGDYRADVFSVGALWYAMLTGTALPDPMDAEPCSALDKMPLPPRLQAVLRGALDVRDRRHHSAASMAEALRVAMRNIAAPPPWKKRAWWLAPGLGAVILPTWLVVRSGPPMIDCPRVSTPVQPLAAPVARPLPAEPAASGVLQHEAPGEPEPAAQVAEEARITGASDNKRVTAPRRRFDLSAALAKCKPHPTTRLEVKYDPAGPLKINDDPPQGEMGRCVADVLQRHPPRRAVTLTP